MICGVEWPYYQLNQKISPSIARKIALKTESDHINDIIGPRRAGKAYLMFSTIRALLEERLTLRQGIPSDHVNGTEGGRREVP